MPKKKSRKKNSVSRSKRRSYSTKYDGHPLFTALFIIFCVVIAALALFTLALHKIGEEADDHMTISQPTPAVTISPSIKRAY